MKSWSKRVLSLGLAALITAGAAGTGTSVFAEETGASDTSVSASSAETAAESIRLDQSSYEGYAGDSFQLKASVTPDTYTGEITWKSSDPDSVSVDEDGKVSLLMETDSAVTITASAGDASADCKITVKPWILTLDKSRKTITMNQYFTLNAVDLPEGRTVSYASEDPSIAAVYPDGTVIGKSVGTTSIIVTSGDQTASCTVTVLDSSLSVAQLILPEKETVVIDTPEQLPLEIEPEEAENKEITWTSSDESVAAVDSSGTVTGLKAGTAVITAASSNGVTAECTVTVIPPIELNKTSVTLEKGKKEKLTATLPEGPAATGDVAWSSSDKTVATVSKAGTVTAVKEGTAVITAKTKEGKTADCTVTVLPSVKSITLSKETLKLAKGKTSTLKATVSPDNAVDPEVTWSSSNEKVATVSKSGKIKAKKLGKVTITAETKNGAKASCKVTVVLPATKSIKAETASLTSIKLTWEKVTSASGYYIYRYEEEAGKYKRIAAVKGNKTFTYENTGITPGTTYTYKVRAYSKKSDYNGVTSDAVSAVGRLDTPVVKASKFYANKIKITWNAVPNAKGYYLYRKTGKNGTYTKVSKISGGSVTSYINSVKPFTAYYYKVKAYYSPGTANSLWSKEVGKKAYPRITVPYLDQLAYPTGCEAVSATMLMQYYGAKVSIQNIVDAMPKGNLYYLNQQLWGPHPSEAFIGSPTSSNSYGCYAPVVAEAMNSLLPTGKKAVVLSNVELTDLQTYLNKKDPVLIWATIGMVESETFESNRWMTTSGPFQWISHEHCLVLTGYDSKYYYFNDPYNANGKVKFERSLVKKRYAELGKQAVVIQDGSSGGSSSGTETDSVPAASVKLDVTEKSLTPGKTVQLQATVSPSNADDTSVTWSSSSTSVAKVSSAGRVTATGKGSCVITAATSNGRTAACTITVTETLVKYTTTDFLNYRTGPGTSYTSKGVLSEGTVVSVVKGYAKTTADGNKWYMIKLSGKYYYVSSAYLKKNS